MGRYLGLEKFVEEIKESAHMVKEVVKFTSSAVNLQAEVAQFQEKSMRQGEISPDSLEVPQQILERGVETLWRMGLLEIERIVRYHSLLPIFPFVITNRDEIVSNLVHSEYFVDLFFSSFLY